MTSRTDMSLKPLTAQEQVFVEEYLIDLDVNRAALAAGYSKTMAHTKAYQWVSNGKIKPHVYLAVKEAQKKLAEKAVITQEMVLERYWQIANADPNELMQVRRTACGDCWPEKGRQDINKGCLRCHGEGLGYVHVHDSRKLKGDAKRLYAGAKHTKSGIEVKTHDQMAALGMIARHLGMFKQELQHSGSVTLASLIAASYDVPGKAE